MADKILLEEKLKVSFVINLFAISPPGKRLTPNNRSCNRNASSFVITSKHLFWSIYVFYLKSWTLNLKNVLFILKSFQKETENNLELKNKLAEIEKRNKLKINYETTKLQGELHDEKTPKDVKNLKSKFCCYKISRFWNIPIQDSV